MASEQIMMSSGGYNHNYSSDDRKKILPADVINFPYKFSHINHLHFLKEFFTGKIALNHKGKLKLMEKDPFSIDVFALYMSLSRIIYEKVMFQNFEMKLSRLFLFFKEFSRLFHLLNHFSDEFHNCVTKVACFFL